MASKEGMKNHVIICGYGLVGEMVADILMQHGAQFVVIEPDQTKVDNMRQRGISVVKGDATLAKSLREANIASAKAIAIVIDDDATDLFAVITARSLNSKIVIATRVNDAGMKSKMKDAGANYVATPNQSVVDELFGELLKGYGR